MDTKSRKSRPFLSWLCFFIGLSIIFSLTLFSLIVLGHNSFGFNDIKTVYDSDYKETSSFKSTICSMFNNLTDTLANTEVIEASSSEGVSSENYLGALNEEGTNLIYYARNAKTGKQLSNSNQALDITQKGLSVLPEGYDYYIYFNGSSFIAEKNGKTLDIYRIDSGYRNIDMWRYSNKVSDGGIKDINDYRILLIVKKNIENNPYGYSDLYSRQQTFYYLKWILPSLAGLFILGILLLVVSIVMRKQKHEFDVKLAGYTGNLWLEVKVVLTVVFIAFFSSIAGSTSLNSLAEYLIPIIPLGICGWWLYLMVIDLVINKRKVFTNNIINSIIKKYKAFESTKPIQKSLILRVYALLLSEFFLMLLALLMLFAGFGNPFPVFLSIFIIITCIYLLYRYLRRYKNTVNDIGRIIDQIDEIKYGNMHEKHDIMLGADLFQAQDGLNRIQEGMSRVIDEKMRSERMKVELITNVSHDLKTPLTSIISYVDLLSKEEELPLHVKDYISILSQKSERLKTLIQDLFDLSKVNSGNIVIEHEKLDLCKVVRQTLGEMDEEITKSGLAFKVRLPEEPIIIMSDGTKLYRVFQNLVSNTLKYSLAGSRVYIDVLTESKKAVAVIKNTANYEMNFDESEIVERFVRADEARTTEGTGLGLAIAKSFTQACGGRLEVKVDGDLFKVTVMFEICD